MSKTTSEEAKALGNEYGYPVHESGDYFEFHIDKLASLIDDLRGVDAEPVAESQCANCGKVASEAKSCISEFPEEGEWFCSNECHEQHGELGCPHEHHNGYRHPKEAARLIACEAVLRSLASYVGNGGYNAPEVDAAVFEAKIRGGIDRLAALAPSQPAAPVELPVVGEIERGHYGGRARNIGFLRVALYDKAPVRAGDKLVKLSDAQAAIAAGRKA